MTKRVATKRKPTPKKKPVKQTRTTKKRTSEKKTLYNKHRPPSLNDHFYGNNTLKRTLQSFIDAEEIPNAIMLSGPHGCVDCDTEFFTSTGWKKISNYIKGDQVLQYDPNNKIANLIMPEKYIKKQSDVPMFHFKTKYGLDQCLSDDHRTFFITQKGIHYTIPFQEVRENHTENISGFSGKFYTSFNIKNNTIFPLSDKLLRVQVMLIADSHIPSNSKKCALNLKKKRKIERAIQLLNEAKIPFDKYPIVGGYTRIHFVPPIRIKEYTDDFYRCSFDQLKIITSEVMFWDVDQKNIFYSTIKKSADFIQYAFAATNVKASINIDDRVDKPLTYRVIISSTNLSKISPDTKINPYKPSDGYQYCFTVPTGYLVLRRNNCIFITGNCGKTSIGRIIKNELKCSEFDFREIDAADFKGIDTIRNLRKTLRGKPMEGPVKVYMFDESHRLTGDAKDAMLKMLEEPPEWVYFILCTTEPEKLTKTIKSRCTQLVVQPLAEKTMIKLLTHICKEEDVEVPEEVMKQITQDSVGHPRDAIVLLNAIMRLDEDVMLEAAKLEAEQRNKAIELCRALINGKQWKTIASILKSLEETPETIRRIIRGYFKAVLLNGKLDAAIVMDSFKIPYYNIDDVNQLTLDTFTAWSDLKD